MQCSVYIQSHVCMCCIGWSLNSETWTYLTASVVRQTLTWVSFRPFLDCLPLYFITVQTCKQSLHNKKIKVLYCWVYLQYASTVKLIDDFYFVWMLCVDLHDFYHYLDRSMIVWMGRRPSTIASLWVDQVSLSCGDLDSLQQSNEICMGPSGILDLTLLSIC